MADAPIVVTAADGDTPAIGQLFQDINFFLAARLPTRSRLVADVEANGGRVVKTERNADYVIIDHLRKPIPAGSFSYTLIEQALRDGAFPDPAKHAAEIPGSRAVGSKLPTKNTRTPYTAEDDKTLWEWVQRAKAQGDKSKGVDIYKELEAMNPRHTWQSWRDRYVKTLINKPPFGAATAADASPNQPSEPDDEDREPKSVSKKRRRTQVEQEEEEEDEDENGNIEGASRGSVVKQADLDLLWQQADDIEQIDESMYDQAWDAWAEMNGEHTALSWRQIWEVDVRPAYLKQRAQRRAKRRHNSLRDDDDNDDEETTVGKRQRKKGKKRQVVAADSDVEANPLQGAENSGTRRKRERTPRPVSVERLRPMHGSDIPTSDVNHAANQQIQTEINGTALTEPHVSNEPLATSDANFAADLQVQGEANGGDMSQTNEQFVTSEANRDADTQLQLDAPNGAAGRVHIEEAQQTENDNSTLSGELRAWFAERVAELNAAPELTESGRNFEDEFRTEPYAGHALTEANLINQQAEHAPPRVRGIDLPEDDHNKDQSDYVNFLQNVTGQPREEEALESAQDANFDGDLPSTPPPRREKPLQHGAAGPQIPLSSEREVNDVMEDAFDWPSSPQHKRKQLESQSQSQHFETQVPPQSNDVRAVALTGQPDIFEGLADINDTHIDLSIPEPEGGFTFTSSPQREHPAASRKVALNQQPNESGESDVDDLDAIEKYAEKPNRAPAEILTISSDAPSSSLRSSQESGSFPKPVRSVQEQKSHAVDTQDIVNAKTQIPDLYMPLPPDSEMDDEQDQEDRLAPQRSNNHAKETQDILAAETQAPDLSLPLPPESDSEETAQALHSKEASPPKQGQLSKGKGKVVESQTMDVEEELESWLNTQQVRGFSDHSALTAMQRTSMRPDLAELVLLAERSGVGLPKDVPGVWSDREDEIVESGDAGALRRLEAKHGWAECHARMQFLAKWREM